MTEEKLCFHCRRLESDHAITKCVFIPSFFRQMHCFEWLPYIEGATKQCRGVIHAIIAPTMTEETWLSWRCDTCDAKGHQPR